MSLVNQMLQDLEQRRTAEASASPLGGLSASSSASSSAIGGGFRSAVVRMQPINYLLLTTTLMLVVGVVFVLVYLFGLKQSVAEEIVAPKTSSVAMSVVMSNVSPTAVPAIQQPVAKQKQVKQKSAKKTQPVEETTQGVVQKLKTGTTRLAANNYEVENSGSISILAREEGKSIRGFATNSDNNVGNNAVNKTIHPLTSEQRAKMAFQDAVKLLGRGDELTAQQKLEEALSFEPIYSRARETLSALLLNTGRVSEAAEKLKEGLRLRPSSAPLAKLYARVLVDQGDNDEAVAVLERARPLATDDPDYYALLAVLYRGVGKHAQSSQAYQKILQVRPGVAVWWMGLALSEDAMGASDRALVAYQRAERAGGLKAEVLKYVQSRIVALTPDVSEKSVQLSADDLDGFED